MTSLPTVASRFLRGFAILALLVGLGNALVMVRRLPIQRRLAKDANEQTAQQAAQWIHALPFQTRVAIVVADGEPTGFWFRSCLTYLALPHRLNFPAAPLPLNTPLPYEAIIAYGRAQVQLPARFVPLARASNGLMAVPDTHKAFFSALLAAPDPPLIPRYPVAVRFCCVLVGLVSVVVLGGLALGATLRAPPFPFWWANVACAHLTGAALLGWLGTAMLCAGGHLSVWPVYGMLALLAWFGPRTRRVLFPERARARSRRSLSGGEWLLLGLIVLGIGTAIERGLLIGVEWDGFMIWQMKAKAFFLDGTGLVLQQPTHFPDAHLDYPLLIPFQSWWAFAHWGEFSDKWAQAVDFVFYIDLLAIFAAIACRYLSRSIVLGGLALLASAPFVTEHAVSGYADLAVATYFLVLANCLLQWRTNADSARLAAWMLAGIVLTKNEGMLACLAFLITAFAFARRELRATLLCGIAMGFVYLPWLLLKRRWHLANDLFAPSQPVHFTLRLLWWRLGFTLWNGFARHAALVGPWMPAWGLLLLSFPVGFLTALRRRMTMTLPLWTLCGLQLLGYVGIYLITYSPVRAHIESSIDRLILHVAPTLLLAALIACFASRKDETPNASL